MSKQCSGTDKVKETTGPFGAQYVTPLPVNAWMVAVSVLVKRKKNVFDSLIKLHAQAPAFHFVINPPQEGFFFSQPIVHLSGDRAGV